MSSFELFVHLYLYSLVFSVRLSGTVRANNFGVLIYADH